MSIDENAVREADRTGELQRRDTRAGVLVTNVMSMPCVKSTPRGRRLVFVST